MAGGANAMAIRIDLVVVGSGICGEYYVWIAIYPAMAGIGKERIAGCAGLFLAIEFLGECFEFDLCDALGQRTVAAGRRGLAVYLWEEFGFIKAVSAPAAGRRTRRRINVQPGQAPARPSECLMGMGAKGRTDLATQAGW